MREKKRREREKKLYVGVPEFERSEKKWEENKYFIHFFRNPSKLEGKLGGKLYFYSISFLSKFFH